MSTYWVLKDKVEGIYRMWPDCHGGTYARKLACRFESKADALKSKYDHCCSDRWAVFRVTRRRRNRAEKSVEDLKKEYAAVRRRGESLHRKMDELRVRSPEVRRWEVYGTLLTDVGRQIDEIRHSAAYWLGLA